MSAIIQVVATSALSLVPSLSPLPFPPLPHPLPLCCHPRPGPGVGWGSLPLGLLAGGAGALGAELRHGRGADRGQQDPHGPAGQCGELRGGADEDGDIFHGGDGAQVDHEQHPLQILVQSHLPRLDGSPLLQGGP